jgi:hypothetical protein
MSYLPFGITGSEWLGYIAHVVKGEDLDQKSLVRQWNFPLF